MGQQNFNHRPLVIYPCGETTRVERLHLAPRRPEGGFRVGDRVHIIDTPSGKTERLDVSAHLQTCDDPRCVKLRGSWRYGLTAIADELGKATIFERKQSARPRRHLPVLGQDPFEIGDMVEVKGKPQKFIVGRKLDGAEAETARAVLMVKCPECQAPMGERCNNYKGKGCAPHRERIAKARAIAPSSKGGRILDGRTYDEMPPTLPGVETTPAAPAPPTDDPDRWDTFQIKGKDGRHSGWGFVDKRLRSFLAELGAHVKPKQAIAAITNGFEIHKDELAVLLGSNRRTIWRWETNQTHPSEFEALLLGALVRAAVDDRLAVARANVARLLRAYGGAYALTFALACVMPPPADMGRSPASWAM